MKRMVLVTPKKYLPLVKLINIATKQMPAINEIIDAFAELQDKIRNEYENHTDDLRIELDFLRMRNENLQERIENLEFENDDLQLENSELRDELGIWRSSFKK